MQKGIGLPLPEILGKDFFFDRFPPRLAGFYLFFALIINRMVNEIFYLTIRAKVSCMRVPKNDLKISWQTGGGGLSGVLGAPVPEYMI